MLFVIFREKKHVFCVFLIFQNKKSFGKHVRPVCFQFLKIVFCFLFYFYFEKQKENTYGFRTVLRIVF